LIEHAEDPARLMRALEEKEQAHPIQFEREVMKRLAAAGYGSTPLWKIGTFSASICRRAMQTLAIECDGDRFNNSKRLPEDMSGNLCLNAWVGPSPAS